MFEGGVLDTTLCLDLTEDEQALYDRLVAQEKERLESEIHAVRGPYVEKRAQDLATKKGIPIEEARAGSRKMYGGDLDPETTLYFAKLGAVTVLAGVR